MNTITKLSQSSLGVLVFFGILAFLTFIAILIFKLFKNRDFKAEIAGQKVEAVKQKEENRNTREALIQQTIQESREESDDITISKFVFAQLLDSCLEKAISYSTGLNQASIAAEENQKKKVHQELVAVAVQMTLEYGQKLEELATKDKEKLTNSELLNFELEKDFKEHFETPAHSSYPLESFKNLSDDNLQETASNIVRVALPQLKLSLSKYDILHKEAIYEILAQQENNLVEALKKALKEVRKVSSIYVETCTKQTSAFRKDIVRNVEARVGMSMEDSLVVSKREE